MEVKNSLSFALILFSFLAPQNLGGGGWDFNYIILLIGKLNIPLFILLYILLGFFFFLSAVCFIKFGLNKPLEETVNKITQYLYFSLKTAQSRQNTQIKECLILSNPALDVSPVAKLCLKNHK